MPKSEKWRLERNNKEILKNNILIKIEFWDAGNIVKWDGIMIKWLFVFIYIFLFLDNNKVTF